MIIPFNKQFLEPILNGSKIHTIREDKHNRWKPGMKIHFATGVRTKNYNQFRSGVCISTQSIRIRHYNFAMVYIGDRLLSEDEVKTLALNDGFESTEKFFEWFNQDFKGKIIHWTGFKY